MNPERFLGTDPAPGDLRDIDDLAGTLRECVLVLAEGRRRLDQVIGQDSVWKGPHAAVIADAVGAFVARLRIAESAVVEFAQAWQDWRIGVARRQDESAELVEEMSQLAGQEGRQRDAVLERATGVEETHRVAAVATSRRGEELVAALGGSGEAPDLAAELNRGLAALHSAVEEWLVAAAEQLQRAAASVDTVVELTSVVPTLIGVSAKDDAPSATVLQMASHAPGSHRLRKALESTWDPVDPADLPAASFEQDVAPSLGERIKGVGGAR